MKKILLIFLFSPLFLFAQEYSEVIEVPNKTAVQQYRIAKEWFAYTFKSSNDVIQLDDSIQKKIIGKGIQQVEYFVKKIPVFMSVYFTLAIQFKDNRCKYDIQSTQIKSSGGEIYSYEQLKLIATEDGLTEYYKQQSVNSWIVGKKGFQENLKNNQLLVILIDKKMHGIVDDLTTYLKKEDATNNW